MLPEIPDRTVNAVAERLLDRETLLRPPEWTAKFLVLCVKLHEAGLSFATRKVAADHLGLSVAAIDTALSQRLMTGDIRVESTRPYRIIPSQQIIDLVRSAEGEANG